MALSDFEKDLLRQEFTIPHPPEGTTYTDSHCLLNAGDKLRKDMPVLDLSVSTIAEQNGQKQITRSQTTICCPYLAPEDCIFEACKISENTPGRQDYARVTFFLPDTFSILSRKIL